MARKAPRSKCGSAKICKFLLEWSAFSRNFSKAGFSLVRRPSQKLRPGHEKHKTFRSSLDFFHKTSRTPFQSLKRPAFFSNIQSRLVYQPVTTGTPCNRAEGKENSLLAVQRLRPYNVSSCFVPPPNVLALGRRFCVWSFSLCGKLRASLNLRHCISDRLTLQRLTFGFYIFRLPTLAFTF